MEVHQVRTPLSNSYIVEEEGRLLVVDVAARCHGYVLGAIEEQLALDRRAVELVICTHDDVDHLGGVRHLALACNAPFALPLASRSRLRKVLNDPSGWAVRLGTSALEALRPRAWKMYTSPSRQRRVQQRPRRRSGVSPRDLQGLRPMTRLADGNLLPGFPSWRVIHTPGHSWDSCCYYHQNSGALLSGDTLLGSARKNRLVRPSIISNPDHFRASLEKLRELDVRSVHPGHGSSFAGRQLLDEV